jgi:putative phosphoesterase
MLIGLLSDSHDNLPKIKRAVSVINDLSVEIILHAGDYCAPFAAGAYDQLKAHMVGVFGNNDAEREIIRQKFAAIGHEIRGRFGEIKVDDVKIALTHGDDPELLASLTDSGSYRVIVHGHNHQAKVTEHASTLLVNPGEICGYLTGRYTVGVLDTDRMSAKIVDFE